MARPSKTVENTVRHSTKAEIAHRKAAEKAALTGIPIRESLEVKSSNAAHSEYERVIELLSAAGKNDALYEAVINDYCVYKADILRYMEMREAIRDDDSIDSGKRYKLIMDADSRIETYRAKRFAIEKENGFTIASALRAIPKKPEVKSDPLLDALRGGADVV